MGHRLFRGVLCIHCNNGKVRGNQRQKETFWEQPLDVPPTTKLSSRCYTIPMGMIASNRLPSNMFSLINRTRQFLGVYIFFTQLSPRSITKKSIIIASLQVFLLFCINDKSFLNSMFLDIWLMCNFVLHNIHFIKFCSPSNSSRSMVTGE